VDWLTWTFMRARSPQQITFGRFLEKGRFIRCMAAREQPFPGGTATRDSPLERGILQTTQPCAGLPKTFQHLAGKNPVVTV
jgi:hypothetical protein